MTESTPKKKGNFLVKEVKFGREKLTLYSLDGLTWSTRRNELADIKARQEREKVTFNQIKGVAEAEEPAQDAAEEEGQEPTSAADDEETPRRRFKGAKPAAPAAPAAKKGKPSVSLVAPKTKGKHATEPAKVAAPKKRGSTTPPKKSPKAKAKKRRAA
ncbi:MAG: hypothetical protein K1X83_13310 [Oligoflexia bacterium]|nr:hypothetical protein [Oligoflexia bacterium]